MLKHCAATASKPYEYYTHQEGGQSQEIPPRKAGTVVLPVRQIPETLPTIHQLQLVGILPPQSAISTPSVGTKYASKCELSSTQFHIGEPQLGALSLQQLHSEQVLSHGFSSTRDTAIINRKDGPI